MKQGLQYILHQNLQEKNSLIIQLKNVQLYQSQDVYKIHLQNLLKLILNQLVYHADVIACGDLQAGKIAVVKNIDARVLSYNEFLCRAHGRATSYDIGVEISLDNRNLINRAHRRNMAVQYWTINDAEDMRRLIKMGCDCIMTDDPELMRQVLDEME